VFGGTLNLALSIYHNHHIPRRYQQHKCICGKKDMHTAVNLSVFETGLRTSLDDSYASHWTHKAEQECVLGSY